MKKSFLFLALVLIFTQCQVPPIIQSPPSPQELDAVCDSISTNKYFPAQAFNLHGRIIIDYSSTVIDSSDNDSVFIYVDVSAQIDMDINSIEHINTGSTELLDTPTHVCLDGGPCLFSSSPDITKSHIKVFKFKECTVFKMGWSSTAGLLKSTNSITMLALAQPKVSMGFSHPAMKPNYQLHQDVYTLMYNKDWWIITINNKTERYDGGYFWDFY